ncbi:MAG TPA: lysophospholipid acyltransferase family protein [Halanaerobiaceae bacterium]|jgi:KDO2-lipid IV(A) lauroyltransferase|nr:lysophospholipid acyltransferase family protein [Bacillota bacterium]HHU93142.1 lysophospholipid acyltransferase family protein [Halanaerobiaceae bacterium]HOA40133.1 lysophospholipid acyltransferase family protein [Halanaerobiales bacterium]HPZ63808.1 lysophospholipid acyltransferase family protein [Halanaerobiales bacterium]HQD05002.1 lysophospholipid acyltransferase family protein [Halanaerobiales bacterium]
MLDLVLYSFFLVIYFLINIFPRGYLLGRGLGKLIYGLLKDRREVTIDNLKMVYGEELSAEELTGLCKEVYCQLGITLIEFMKLKKLKKEDLAKVIEVEGAEYLKEAYETGRGVIVYSAHFGNWEWLASILSLQGYPLNAIARTQNNPYFDKKINEIRTSKGVKIIPRGMSVRQAITALKRGELLLILGDQNGRKDGWLIDFFGKPASTYPGAVQLAQRTGAVVVPAYLIRKEPGKFLLKIYPYYDIPREATRDEQKDYLVQLTENMEEVIRQYPEQWLWLHRRWDLSHLGG